MMTSLRDLTELVRGPAALSVPGDAVAGAAAARTLGPRTAGLSAAAVCLYWAGMAANDWADRDIDAVERPGRPIPSGRVAPATALGVAAGLSAAGLVVAGLAGGRRALAVAVPLTAMVWGYDLKLKHTRAGPAAMAACRALDVLLGASGGPGSADSARSAGDWRAKGSAGSAVPTALVVGAHTYTVTVLSTREVTGATAALPGATLLATASVAAAAAGRAPGWAGWRRRRVAGGRLGLVRAGLAAWYATAYGRRQLRAMAEPDAGNLRAAVAAGITGLPALQGALTAGAGAPGAGVAVALAAPVGGRLARKVSPT